MLDATVRRAYAPLLATVAEGLHRRSVRAVQVTGAGFGLGLAAAGAAGAGWWLPALGLWLASRVLDGLDGTIARLEGATARGGFLDIVADFTVYGAFVAGVAVQVPAARLAAVALLCTYYVSGAAFLAWSSLAAERRAARSGQGLAMDDDGRSLRFVGGLAEGTETVIVYCVVCIVPVHADVVLWVFAAMVGVTALQRVAFAVSDLGRPRAE